MKLRKILAGLVAGVMAAGAMTLPTFAEIERVDAKATIAVASDAFNFSLELEFFESEEYGIVGQLHDLMGINSGSVTVTVSGITEGYELDYILVYGTYTPSGTGEKACTTCTADNCYGVKEYGVCRGTCIYNSDEGNFSKNDVCNYEYGKLEFFNVSGSSSPFTISDGLVGGTLRSITEFDVFLKKKTNSDDNSGSAPETSTPAAATTPALTTPVATTAPASIAPLVDEKSGVSISAAAGVLEEGTELKVETADVETDGNTATFDITLEKDGVKVNPNGTVTVTIDVPAALAGASKYYVYYQADDGTLTDMKATYADGKVTFNTNHFSTYILSVEPLIAEETTAAATSEESTTAVPDVTTEAPAAITNETTTTPAATTTETTTTPAATTIVAATTTQPASSAGSTDSGNNEDKNQPTGVSLIFIPAIAAAAGIIIAKKRK